MSEFDEWKNSNNTDPPEPNDPYASQDPQNPMPNDSYTPQDPQNPILDNPYASQDPKQSPSQAMMPRKKTPLWLFAILGTIICIVIATVVCFRVPSISNALSLMITNPQKYYAKIETKSANVAIDTISQIYGQLITELQTNSNIKPKIDPSGISANIDFVVDPDFADEMNLTTLTDLNSVRIFSNFFVDSEKMKSSMEFKYKEDSFSTITTLLNYINQETYIQIKELSDSYLHSSPSTTLKDIDMYNQDFYNSEDIIELLKSFPLTEHTLNSILKRYSNTVISNLNHVTWEKNIFLESNGIKNKATKLTVVITEQNIYDIAAAILSEAEKDTELSSLFTANGDISTAEYNAAISLIKVGLEQYKNTLIQSKITINMDIWINHQGKIIGRTVDLMEDNQPMLNYGYRVSSKASDTGYEAWLTFDESTSSNIKLVGLASENKNVYSGQCHLNIDNNINAPFSIDFSYENIAKRQKSKELEGKFTASTSILPAYQLTAEFTNDKEKQMNAVVDLLYQNKKAFTLNITGKPTEYEDFTLPNKSDTYDIDTQVEAYLEQAHTEAYIKKLQNIFKISDEDLSSLFDSYNRNHNNTIPLPGDDNYNPSVDTPSIDKPNTGDTNLSDYNLPEGVTPDESGWYEYEITSEDAIAIGAPSTGYGHFSKTIQEVQSEIDQLSKKYITNATIEEPHAYNHISGSISEDYNYEYTFLTISETWSDPNEYNNSLSVLYDTVNHQIVGIDIYNLDKDKTMSMLMDSLELLEGKLSAADKKKLLEELSLSQDTAYAITEYGNSNIYINEETDYYSATITAIN